MFYRFLTILRNTLLNVIFLYFFIWKNYVETSILTILVLSIQLLFNKVSNPSVKYWPTFTQIPELPWYMNIHCVHQLRKFQQRSSDPGKGVFTIRQITRQLKGYFILFPNYKGGSITFTLAVTQGQSHLCKCPAAPPILYYLTVTAWQSANWRDNRTGQSVYYHLNRFSQLGKSIDLRIASKC